MLLFANANTFDCKYTDLFEQYRTKCRFFRCSGKWTKMDKNNAFPHSGLIVWSSRLYGQDGIVCKEGEVLFHKPLYVVALTAERQTKTKNKRTSYLPEGMQKTFPPHSAIDAPCGGISLINTADRIYGMPNHLWVVLDTF